jgi:pSer/pThr/pTyr-binding forkhead associated (FHA) protein
MWKVTDQKGAPPAVRRAAVDVIDAVVENMRTNLEPLKYSTLAPSRFVVYLHPDEFARVERILPVLQEQTSRALEEALRRLNRRPIYRKYLGGAPPPVENAAAGWQIDVLPDADGELAPGDILVHSELTLPPNDDELGAGERTRRITTVHAGDKTTRRATVSHTDAAAPKPVHARLRYEDKAGPHTFDMARDSITIGRGGIAYRADVKIEASVDVSREHARIRRDAASGRFFLIDLSTLGTTVNGQRVPRGYDEADGTKRENGAEVALPDGARIGLADTVFLQFDVAGRG